MYVAGECRCLQHERETAAAGVQVRGSWLEMAVDRQSAVPLFARAGFIIPTQTPANNTAYRHVMPCQAASAFSTSDLQCTLINLLPP